MVQRFFNTAGPIKPDIHYSIAPLTRIDTDEIMMLIKQEKYFVLHAPRQTGKTSCLLALRDYINQGTEYHAIYINVEAGQAERNNVANVNNIVITTIAREARDLFKTTLADDVVSDVFASETKAFLAEFLNRWCQVLTRPLVLMIDEIDSLVGDSLVSILRQIRSGYNNRPSAFPISIILCGVRDVRDYRIHTANQEIITGGSAFNIKSESLRLGNFSPEEVIALYLQHTAATGQEFDPECFPLIWTATEGQPWLTNALGYEVTMKMRENRDRSIRITPEMMYRAQENLIYRRETHIDILIDKLREDRVRRVIAPILSGEEDVERTILDDDIQYVVDMGLVVRDKPLRVANAIYREIIPRELTWSRQQTLVQQSAWYIRPDNTIDMEKLLIDFQNFFRANSDSWIERFDYKESGPQLLLQAFLQRVVNGGGYIDREYGLGCGRTDLLIRKPLTDGYGGAYQRIVLELKIKRTQALETLIGNGLKQTADYMDKCGNVKEGHFILFNRDKDVSWEEKIWHRREQFGTYEITVWGM